MITADTSRPSSPNAPKPRPTPPPPAPVPGRMTTQPGPGLPPGAPHPDAPAGPPHHGGRVDVYATEYRCQAIRTENCRHTLVGEAIRTLWGWHVIVPTAKGQPKRWRSVATAYDAAQELYALAGAR